MTHEELAAWLRLMLTPGVGLETTRKLLQAFGLPEQVFGQGSRALQQVVSPAQASALQAEPTELPDLLARTWDWLQADRPFDVSGSPAIRAARRNTTACTRSRPWTR